MSHLPFQSWRSNGVGGWSKESKDKSRMRSMLLMMVVDDLTRTARVSMEEQGNRELRSRWGGSSFHVLTYKFWTLWKIHMLFTMFAMQNYLASASTCEYLKFNMQRSTISIKKDDIWFEVRAVVSKFYSVPPSLRTKLSSHGRRDNRVSLHISIQQVSPTAIWL